MVRWPWLVSLAFHGAVTGLVLTLLQQPTATPQALRMRLVSPASVSTPAGVPTPSSQFPKALTSALPAVEAPAWQTIEVPSPSASWTANPPVVLEELLGQDASSPEPVWSVSGGPGYEPPTLPPPPPGLAPIQGTRWTLTLFVPAGGGPARSFEGLDSGHPELDHWLELYLRTVSFPSSTDGNDYQVRWTLRLESGKPQ